MTRLFCLIGFAIGLGGCATRLYSGPGKSRAEVTIIEAKDVEILQVDGRKVWGSSFELLPGAHSLIVRLPQAGVSSAAGYRLQGGVSVCFTARPGHEYLVIPGFLDAGRWQPEIVDQATTYRTTVRRALPGTAECRGEHPPAVAVASPPPPEAGSPALPDETPAADEPATSAAEAPPDEPSPRVPDDESPPPARPPPRSDTPRIRTSGEVPSDTRGGTGIGLESGLFIGGDELVRVQRSGQGKTETIKAGSGLLFGFNAMVTPVWLGSVGLGVALNVGWKGDRIEGTNGAIVFSRVPIGMSAQALLPTGDRWYLLQRLGVFGDFAAKISGNGVGSSANVELSTGLGMLVETGVYWAPAGRSGLAITARYSRLDYTLNGQSIDGDSAGLSAAAYYRF